MSDSKAAYNDLNLRTIWLIGLLSAVGLFVIITGARVLYQKWQIAEFERKQVDIPLASVNRELQAQREVIDRYGWNEVTNSAQVPVAEAMEEVVADLSAKKKRGGEPAGPPEA